jgi:DNA primase
MTGKTTPADPTPTGPSLEEFKAKLPLVEIVARHVRLQRRGRGDHWGCCPFHKEKSASFHVDEGRGFYHCFGCGAHGNAIDFVMQLENLDFAQALERLEELTGIPAPRRAGGSRQPPVDRSLAAANDAALAWFRRQLAGPAGGIARAYLERRGIAPASVARFELGWAPGDGDGIGRELAAAGFSPEQLIEAGLVARGERGAYDRFRARLIFPIRDVRGRVVGFGGRALGDAQPKYLNTAETPLFHKAELLYGLPLAQKAAREARMLVVAEGYLDVIALDHVGIPAVAPLGTAIGEAQIRLLWRCADEPILCFDGDAAGRRAAARAAERALPLLSAGRSLRIAILPPGEDPDSLVRRGDEALLRGLLERALPLVEFIWRQETEGRGTDTPERLAALRRRLADLSRQIGDPEVGRLYDATFRERLAGLLPNRHKREPMRPRDGSARRLAPSPGAGAGALAAAIRRRERAVELVLLEPFLVRPDLLVGAEEELALVELRDAELDRLRQELLAWYATRSDLDAAGLRRHLHAAGLSELLEACWPDGPQDRAYGDDVGSASLLERWRHALSVARRRSERIVEADELESCLRDGAADRAAARLRSLDGLLNAVADEVDGNAADDA